jgi:hypothetical protein
MEELRVDAYSPPEIAKRIAAVAEKKSGLDFFRMFVLAILAGVFIALGAEFYTLVTHDSGLAFGLNSLIGGLVFCLGLILVVIAGTIYRQYPYRHGFYRGKGQGPSTAKRMEHSISRQFRGVTSDGITHLLYGAVGFSRCYGRRQGSAHSQCQGQYELP